MGLAAKSGPIGAARSHAQRPLRREHGEDGEHQTFEVVPEIRTGVKLGLLLRRTDLNDGQAEEIFGGFQGESCA
jgi:hypothetical protein